MFNTLRQAGFPFLAVLLAPPDKTTGGSAPAVPPAPAVKVNRFAAMFGAAVFTPSQNTTVYNNRSGKSRQIAHVLLPYKTADGANLPGTIYARMAAEGSGDPTLDFTVGRGSLEVDKTNAGAMSDWIEFSSMVANDCLKWIETKGEANAVVQTKANGPVVKGLKF